MKNCVHNIPDDMARDCTTDLYAKLDTSELLKEATSLLKFVLWKAKIDESVLAGCQNRSQKRAGAANAVNHREQCRINCGADIVVRNVFPYLLPWWAWLLLDVQDDKLIHTQGKALMEWGPTIAPCCCKEVVNDQFALHSIHWADLQTSHTCPNNSIISAILTSPSSLAPKVNGSGSLFDSHTFIAIAWSDLNNLDSVILALHSCRLC